MCPPDKIIGDDLKKSSQESAVQDRSTATLTMKYLDLCTKEITLIYIHHRPPFTPKTALIYCGIASTR